MDWEPAERVQKSDAGEYRAMIGGEWMPVAKAQKSSTGEYRVMRGEVSTAEPAQPVKIGMDAFPDTLRETLQNTDWGTRNIAGAGTALTNLYEGGKQLVKGSELYNLVTKGRMAKPSDGAGLSQQSQADRIIADEAPVGAIAGNIATALPMMAAGNAPAAVGAASSIYGALQPAENASQRALNTGVGGLLGAGGQVVANKAVSMISQKLSALAEAKSRNSVLDQTLKETIEAGYKVPPSMMPDSGITARILEGVSGKYKTNQLAGIRNQEVTDNLARAYNKLPKDAPITSEAMQGIRASEYAKGYEPVANIGEIPTDKVYADALEAIVSKNKGAARSFPGAVSDDVSSAIFGKATGGTAEKTIFVDGMGQIVHGVNVPPSPKTRSLLHELKQSGGLSNSELSDLGVEGVNKSYPGLMRKDGGKTMDRVVEWMEGSGWISPQDVAMADKSGVGGSHELARDMLRSALNKDPVIHPVDGEAVYNHSSLLQSLEDKGIRQVKIPGNESKSVPALNVDTFDAGDAIKMTQILRDDAGKAFASGDKALGRAKKDAAKAIEDQIERHLFSMGKDGGDLLKNFRATRTAMAKSHTTEDAIREGGGRVDAKVFGRRIQSGKPLTDEGRTIGNFANNFRDVAGIPQSGHANPFTVLDMFSGGLGAGMANPAVLGLPAARVAARYGVLSPFAQRAISAPSYEMSPALRMGGGLLGYSPVGGTVLGLNALGQ
jgi:hypothetical protein